MTHPFGCVSRANPEASVSMIDAAAEFCLSLAAMAVDQEPRALVPGIRP